MNQNYSFVAYYKRVNDVKLSVQNHSIDSLIKFFRGSNLIVY